MNNSLYSSIEFLINLGVLLLGIYFVWMANFAPDSTINRWRKSALIHIVTIPSLRRFYGLAGTIMVILGAFALGPN